MIDVDAVNFSLCGSGIITNMNEEANADWKKEMDERLDRFFFNRPIYAELTAPLLEKASDEDLLQIIYDNIILKIGDDWARQFEIIASLSDGRKMIYSTWGGEVEVNNGGFNQYYFNSSGEFAETALWAFRLIGANRFADLMARANSVFLENRDALESFDDGTLESFSESYKDNPLNELDDIFYRLQDEENLQKLRIDYVRANISEFVP